VNLLKAALYDPAAAVSKATSALLAMTAFDTTNLRLAITVPAHGMVRFRMRCAIVGATTCPVILLGVLNGATVIGRVQPTSSPVTAPAATQVFQSDAEFIATGLTPGAMNVDAAYAVQVLVAATNIKYGGPNTNAGANAWGGFVFEAWDPQPLTANSTLAVDTNGRVDVGKVLGTAQTAGDLKASLNTLQADTDDIQTRLPAALVGGRMDSSVGAMAANVLTAAAINADAITDAKVAADVTIASVTGAVGSVTGAVGSVTGAVGSVTGNVGGNVTGSVGSVVGLTAANLDVAVSTRLATAGYTVPPTVGAIRAEIDTNSTGLAAIFARTDVATSTRLASAGYTAPDNAGVAAIKAKTDSLGFTVPGYADVNIRYVNGHLISGDGAGTTWGPA
jgi:hypothetical protein